MLLYMAIEALVLYLQEARAAMTWDICLEDGVRGQIISELLDVTAMLDNFLVQKSKFYIN
jgi:hypothetical protein